MICANSTRLTNARVLPRRPGRRRARWSRVGPGRLRSGSRIVTTTPSSSTPTGNASQRRPADRPQPVRGLGLRRTKGNRHRKPPTQEGMERLVELARELTPPSFAAYLEFAMVEGPRPGELDALRWERIRWEAGEVEIVEQWNVKTRTFTE